MEYILFKIVFWKWQIEFEGSLRFDPKRWWVRIRSWKQELLENIINQYI